MSICKRCGTVAARRRANEASANVLIALIHFAHVARILIVVNHLFVVRARTAEAARREAEQDAQRHELKSMTGLINFIMTKVGPSSSIDTFGSRICDLGSRSARLQHTFLNGISIV